ncbi:DUF1924 domain-containing protein [Ferrigenium sp. UT4]
MRTILAMGCALGMMLSALAMASPASDELLKKYQSEGAGMADPDKGRQNWVREDVIDGEKMSCSTTCHNSDFAKEGKHHKTGKVIHPMSAKVNPERYTDVKKMEKWFKRNCNDTWGRDCTAQEKTDFLTFMLAQ